MISYVYCAAIFTWNHLPSLKFFSAQVYGESGATWDTGLSGTTYLSIY